MFRQPGTDAVPEDRLPNPNAESAFRLGRQSRPAPLVFAVGFFKSLLGILDRGRTIADLAKWLDLPEDQLRDWLKGRPPEPRGRDYYYNQFTIPKRRGGTRTIDAPSDGLKALQRRVLQRLLNPLPMHPAATGFVPGRSIVDNAKAHAMQAVVINIDLADFFPSITAERTRQAFQALGWNKDAATILTNISTHEGRLPQGAPTSPALSNLACRRLDKRLAALAQKERGHYTRYADDLTLSFPGFGRNKLLRPKPEDQPPHPAAATSRELLRTIRSIIEQEGFKIQMRKKVRVQRAHQRQTATGLVVNRAVNVPREVCRRMRAMQHHEKLGRLDRKGKQRLRGWEAFLAMVKQQRGPQAAGTGSQKAPRT